MTSILGRAGRVALTALTAATLVLGLAVAPAAAVQDLGAEQQFIDLINADRRSAGLQSVTPVADVRDVALAWSNQMASDRRMYHNPNYSRQYGSWLRAAENVGWTTVSNMSDPSKVSAAVQRLHKAFMDSPGHRANIMHPSHDHIGLAIEMRANSCPDGVGIRDCMWVTENFRQWDGTQPAGGLSNPYSGSRDASGDGAGDVTISDSVHRGGFDGNEATVERLGRTADSAVQISKARFNGDAATHAVVSRDDRFPDSLAGAPLTADGPLLLTPTGGLSSEVASELQRVLPQGATVYLLGGEVALSSKVDRAIRGLGLVPERLKGATRVDTALRVADEVRDLYGDTGTVAVARETGVASDPDGPTGWVDSVTGGAWAARNHVPIVITPSDTLPAQVRDWLAADKPGASIVFGGTQAISDAVLKQVPRATRISGQDRTDTAAAVATRLWGVTANSNDRQFLVIDGWARDGWRHGLAAAGLSADQGAPMLLANSLQGAQPSSTSNLVSACTTEAVDLLLVGDLTNALASTLDALDGRAC